MTFERERTTGRWLPAEPLPEPFGVLWERLWRTRHRSGERLPLALWRGWCDARSISRVVAAARDTTQQGEN